MGTVEILKSVARAATMISRGLYDRDEPDDIFGDFAQMISRPTNQRLVTLEWWEAFPQVRKWVGERQLQEVFQEKIEGIVDPYEVTYGLDRLEIELDGDLSLITRPEELGSAIAKAFRQGRLQQAIAVLDENQTTYDGVTLFSSSHVQPNEDSADNLLGINRSDAANPTVLEAEAEFIAMRRQLHKNSLIRTGASEVAGDGGSYTIVVYSDGVENAYTRLRDDDFIDDGGTSRRNRFRGAFRLIRFWGSPTDANAVDMIWTQPGGPRPVGFVEAKAPRSIEFDTSNVFRNRIIEFGSDANWAVFPAFWQTVVRQTDT